MLQRSSAKQTTAKADHKAKKGSKATPRKSSEHAEQCAVVQWALAHTGEWPELSYLFSIPNGAKLPYAKRSDGTRYSGQAVWLIKEGLKPGVPDLCLPVARCGYHALWIEMKYARNATSDHQERWIEFLNNNGHLAVVCYGADIAIALLKDYLNGNYKTKGTR